MKNKNFIAIVLIIALISLSCGVIYAESISTVVAGVINRFTTILNAVGSNATTQAENKISDAIAQAQNKIDNIITESEKDVESELDKYTTEQLAKKNYEIDQLINDIEASIKENKADKLNEYKQKIDEAITKEYDKLIKNLTNGS